MHVHNTNKLDKPYKLKLNKFADMTSYEFRSTYAGSKINHHLMFQGAPQGNGSFMYEKLERVPPSVDWRKKVSLSEQELVDCDIDENQGCNGGLMDYAFEFIKKQEGITTEANYSYKAEDGTCDVSKENAPAVSIDGYEKVPVNNENALLKVVANQPVSVVIDAGGSDFQFYSEGVFTGSYGTELDHGVAIVGYGTTLDGTKYWIVKNSWGPEWGEKGYIRMQRGISEKEGLCGIAMDPSYPIKNTSNNRPMYDFQESSLFHWLSGVAKSDRVVAKFCFLWLYESEKLERYQAILSFVGICMVLACQFRLVPGSPVVYARVDSVWGALGLAFSLHELWLGKVPL
ncbi:hypothetical protein GH714_040601 [Hevea brasiliensis]|uniref:Peptidase C1A papain C-terminal domain-containing protein n=1 Tax=Hevea brasiliensis TaxID=3981 RepID=A0A6A6KZ31_HEVBR|nr:hypothetical protein GH714_040601 [Hevea brasiliensis]